MCRRVRSKGGALQHPWYRKSGGISTTGNLDLIHSRPTDGFHLHIVLGCSLVKVTCSISQPMSGRTGLELGKLTPETTHSTTSESLPLLPSWTF